MLKAVLTIAIRGSLTLALCLIPAALTAWAQPMTPEQQALIDDFKSAVKHECVDSCAENKQCSMMCRVWLEFTVECVYHQRSCAEAELAQANFERLKKEKALSDPAPQTSQPGAASPSNPEQRELADQWAQWLRQSLNLCGADQGCKEIAIRSFEHYSRCAAGDRLACNEHARDVADWNTQRRNPATQAAPQDAMMQCLQSAARSAVDSCKKTGCPNDTVVLVVREVQKTLCGYSAIEADAPSQPMNPNFTTCTTRPTSGGGWETTCTQF